MPESPQLPIEIWQLVGSFLDPCDLKTVCLVSRDCLVAAVRLLYQTPRFHPLATKQHWRAFVDRIDSQSGLFDYGSMIQSIDDVWLFVGGEDDSAICPDDSAIDLSSPRGAISKYSVCHLVQRLASRRMLKSLQLHFYSDEILALNWPCILGHLQSLELGMRVADSTLEPLLSRCLDSNPLLQSLTLKRAEISDESLARIAYLRNLKHIEMGITPVNQRSRYQLMTDPRASQEITSDGVAHLLSSLELATFKVTGIAVAPGTFDVAAPSVVRHLSLCLAWRQDMTMHTIPQVVKRFESLESLQIVGSGEKGACISDTTLDEAFILQLPQLCPRLRLLELNHTDIFRNERGCSLYFSCRNSSSELTEFRRKFSSQYPNVRLVCQFPAC
ncbi:hypothetical protein HDU91_000822 [Kappamyces sp. JEL0680]|nr:hypothetical protein HDU91_000822 [Kappamyces sp. JEL0680]